MRHFAYLLTLQLVAAPVFAQNRPAQITVEVRGGQVQGNLIQLRAVAMDSEDGDISASVQWLSSLDGVLGTGATLTTDCLSVGKHLITTAVTDSGGQLSRRQWDLEIEAAPKAAGCS
jgi:hypothetical protein